MGTDNEKNPPYDAEHDSPFGDEVAFISVIRGRQVGKTCDPRD
jgi:hypothetical protein